MKTVQMTCKRCGAVMAVQEIGGRTGLVCPYCGKNARLLVDSDRVRIAQIRAEIERAGMDFLYREHCDRMRGERFRRRGQAAAICVLAAIVAAMLWAYLS